MNNYRLWKSNFIPLSPSPLSSFQDSTNDVTPPKSPTPPLALLPSQSPPSLPHTLPKFKIKPVLDDNNDVPPSNKTDDVFSSSSKNPNIADDDDYDYYNNLDDDDVNVDHKSVPPDFFNILRTFPLFKQAPKSFHSKVVSKLKLMQYHPQEYIIKEGDPSKSMYWILKGTVSVTSTDGESIYAELASGSFFGEIGILFNRPRTATVVARTRVLVGVLTSDALSVVLKSYPLIERRIRDEAQERLAMQDKKNKSEIPVLKAKVFSGSNSTSSLIKQAINAHSSLFSQNHASNASHLATLSSSNVPGPSIPPISASSSSVPPTNPSPLSQSSSNLEPDSSNTKVHLKDRDNVYQTISIQEFIKNLPIFHNLPSHIIHRLALGVEPLTFEPFEYIFHKNDVGSDIYFITNGEVEVINHFNNDIKFDNVLARLKAGDYFGEMTFLSFLNKENNYKRSASIRSVTSVELIVVRSEKLESLCNKYPFIIDDMRQTANQRKSLNLSNDTNHYYKTQSQSQISNQQSMLISQTHSQSPSPGSSLPPSRRLSINFLINDNDTNTNQIPAAAPQPVAAPLFAPNWGFDGSNFNNAFKKIQAPPRSQQISPVTAPNVALLENSDDSVKQTRSVSPLSGMDNLLNTTKNTTVDEEFNFKKRKSVSGVSQSIINNQQININVPPMNGVVPSINNFQNFQSLSRRSSFQYMPHNKRVKLSNLAGGRRRSSILSNNGPLPDKLLLKVFEYLTLPELMKLRVISRRWRQLLYVAPNLFQELDLTPWNTSIDDNALISITDFVGSRPQYINISNCFHITDEGFTYMVNEIGISGNIKSLKMRSNWEVSAMAIMDLTVPSVGKNLEEIDLSNCRKVRDNVLERLIGWDSSNEETNDLVVKFDGSSDDDQFNNDVGCKNLKILNVGYCKHLTDDIMYHISNHANKRLESLDLTRCTTITDKGFQYWTYRSFPNLKKLSLKDCTFLTDKSITSIANAANSLEILDLNFCCALSDISIEVLCLGCQNLRELDLSFCGSAVSDSSLVAISIHLRNMEKLILKGCVRVTRAGIDALLSGCSPLNYINVSQCRNAHVYPGRIPAQKLQVNPQTKSAFVTAGPFKNIIEIVV